MATENTAATGKVRLQYMVRDPVSADDGRDLLEGWDYKASEAMLDGPVCRRVAVVDIDPDTGAVNAGAPFVPPKKGAKLGRYRIKDPTRPHAADFQQVSVFGAVMKTMAMFEEADVLGRPLRWAFDGEQLLVVPRAGRMANAFYHRDSRSLQFFFFEATVSGADTTVYTCLSPDIVAHETTHAILDGIAPDLYDATSPQALGLHEAIADLSAVIFAIRTRRLRLEVLRLSRGDLRNAGAFNEIANHFGAAVAGDARPLRDLNSGVSFSGPGRRPASHAPHDISEVLSGALYLLLVKEHDDIKRAIAAGAGGLEEEDGGQAAGPGDEELYQASGRALAIAGNKFKRIVFRGLDYLPPGEISFADYGRALIAADTASNPDDDDARAFIRKEFVRRGIVADAGELVSPPPTLALPADLDLDLLVRSDWSAYQFAEKHREALMIPPNVPFDVRPRLSVVKTVYRSTGEAETHECLFKVAWRENRTVDQGGGFFDEISIIYGSTLVIDRDTGEVRALLSTSPRHPSQQAEATAANNAMRLAYVADCFDKGLLEIGSPDVQIQNRTLRLRAMGQMLHMRGH
ncbi:hypothetical protein ACFFJ7_14155 [Pseudochelatococcus lubricantis]|uniref:hypothetical protein n=1 Tax=Pseudochelatococcus lubricantis TaxID=1538102 RepID=UPI0035E4DC48